MLSATPHDGRAKSFASLMNMLDPTAIANPEEYTKDEVKGLCIRRFKKDVKDQMGSKYLERTVNLVSCEASPKEEVVFDIFAQMQLDMDTSKPKGTGIQDLTRKITFFKSESLPEKRRGKTQKAPS